MRGILLRRPSASMVVALIALVVAMGGTGYAAITLPKNSVGTAQLKKNAVTTKKIKKGAVNSKKVKNDSLTGADILESSLGKVPSAAAADNAANAGHATNADHATSATRATSATSATNATNATNAIDADFAVTAFQLESLTYVVAGASVEVPAGGADFQFIPCPAGTFPTGGGMNSVTSDDLYIIASFASDPNGAFGSDGWGVRVGNKGAGAASFTGDVVCVEAEGAS